MCAAPSTPRGAAGTDHSGGYVTDAGDPMPDAAGLDLSDNTPRKRGMSGRAPVGSGHDGATPNSLERGYGRHGTRLIVASIAPNVAKKFTSGTAYLHLQMPIGRRRSVRTGRAGVTLAADGLIHASGVAGWRP